MDFTFDLLHVRYFSYISVLVKSAPKLVNSLLTFACAIMLMPKMICMCKMTGIKLEAENRLAEAWCSSGLNSKGMCDVPGN